MRSKGGVMAQLLSVLDRLAQVGERIAASLEAIAAIGFAKALAVRSANGRGEHLTAPSARSPPICRQL